MTTHTTPKPVDMVSIRPEYFYEAGTVVLIDPYLVSTPLLDGGDCCATTCISTDSYTCGDAGYECLDPNAYSGNFDAQVCTDAGGITSWIGKQGSEPM